MERSVAGSEKQQQVPLLEPKLHPPRLHASLVERKRLLEQLNAIAEQKLTLLCAPAGFGKTTAISQWMEDRRAVRLCQWPGSHWRAATMIRCVSGAM